MKTNNSAPLTPLAPPAGITGTTLPAYVHGDKISTIVTTPSGMRLQCYLIAGKSTNKTFTRKPGREWHLEIADSEPTCKTFVWDDSVDVAAKAAEGFTCDGWNGYLQEVIEYAQDNALVLPASPVKDTPAETEDEHTGATAVNGDEWTGERDGEWWNYRAKDGSIYESREVPVYRIKMDNARLVMVDGVRCIAPISHE